MWFRVAAEWKYALHWLRSRPTSRKYDRGRRTSAISLDPGSAHRDESLLKGSGTRIERAQMHYPFTLSPLLKVGLHKVRRNS
jgi:hypothetical protein